MWANRTPAISPKKHSCIHQVSDVSQSPTGDQPPPHWPAPKRPPQWNRRISGCTSPARWAAGRITTDLDRHVSRRHCCWWLSQPSPTHRSPLLPRAGRQRCTKQSSTVPALGASTLSRSDHSSAAPAQLAGWRSSAGQARRGAAHCCSVARLQDGLLPQPSQGNLRAPMSEVGAVRRCCLGGTGLLPPQLSAPARPPTCLPTPAFYAACSGGQSACSVR